MRENDLRFTIIVIFNISILVININNLTSLYLPRILRVSCFQKKVGMMKEILVVSHCILNTASKVRQDEKDLQEEYRLRDALLKEAFEQHVQLLQLPCPEFYLYGPRRWGHVKDQFDNPRFISTCRQLLDPILDQLEMYAAQPADFKIIGIVSVEGSPSCGYRLTCRGPWCGEPDRDYFDDEKNQVVMSEESGVFMETLVRDLSVRGLEIPVLTLEEAVNTISK